VTTTLRSGALRIDAYSRRQKGASLTHLNVCVNGCQGGAKYRVLICDYSAGDLCSRCAQLWVKTWEGALSEREEQLGDRCCISGERSDRQAASSRSRCSTDLQGTSPSRSESAKVAA
jgi:hypothetical protein